MSPDAFKQHLPHTGQGQFNVVIAEHQREHTVAFNGKARQSIPKHTGTVENTLQLFAGLVGVASKCRERPLRKKIDNIPGDYEMTL
jgi:hypothetical protein